MPYPTVLLEDSLAAAGLYHLLPLFDAPETGSREVEAEPVEDE